MEGYYVTESAEEPTILRTFTHKPSKRFEALQAQPLEICGVRAQVTMRDNENWNVTVSMERYYVTESAEEPRSDLSKRFEAFQKVLRASSGGDPTFRVCGVRAQVTIRTGATEEGNTSGSSSSVQSAQIAFQGQRPSFELISRVRGIDFGKKIAKRYYQAAKHKEQNLNLVTYTQISGAVETISHVMALGMSSKRAKHVLILFDTNGLFDQFAHNWPSPIFLRDVETRLLRPLGAGFDCAREKIRRKHCTLYIFAIKKTHADFNPHTFQIWKDVFYWAHHVQESENVSSFLVSPSLILDFARVAGMVTVGAGV